MQVHLLTSHVPITQLIILLVDIPETTFTKKLSFSERSCNTKPVIAKQQPNNRREFKDENC